jgi:hypothetical protein
MPHKISLWWGTIRSPLLSGSLVDISPTVGRAQEWRNVQRTPRQLRQLYEHHAPRGIPNERRRRPLLESQRVLHPRQHGALTPFPSLCEGRNLTVYVLRGQIKYLRVPDALLDVVKEEQMRAREAGKSARGGPHTGGVGRGASYAHHCYCTLIGRPLSQVVVGHHSEVLPSILLLYSFPLRISVISFQAAVVHAVVHRVGAGDAGAEYDVCQCIHLCLPLLMCTATLVIVIVPVRVSELVDDDNHLLHRGYEGLDNCEW